MTTGITHIGGERNWHFWVRQSGLSQEPPYWFRVTPWPVDSNSILGLMETFRGRCRMVEWVHSNSRDVWSRYYHWLHHS